MTALTVIGALLVLALVLVLVLVLAAAKSDPGAWWRGLRTGGEPVLARRPPAEYAEPGHCLVVLGDAGPRAAETIEAVRETTDVDLAQAKDWVKAAPCAVAGGLSRASADRLRARLEDAGAAAWVEDRSVP